MRMINRVAVTSLEWKSSRHERTGAREDRVQDRTQDPVIPSVRGERFSIDRHIDALLGVLACNLDVLPLHRGGESHHEKNYRQRVKAVTGMKGVKGIDRSSHHPLHLLHPR